jgi:hypothetical protein
VKGTSFSTAKKSATTDTKGVLAPSALPRAPVIPACVAFYLRDYGEMKEGIGAHRLLKEHVLSTHWKKLPEGHSESASNQLWRDADKVKDRLLGSAYALYRHDPKYTAHRVSKFSS